MAHQHLKTAYHRLAERINLFPQGAPPSELLYGILKMLFSEREAELVSLLPIRPFDARRAAAVWRTGQRQAGEILNGLADRGILLDIEENGNRVYILPPPMAGFFEFSLMRLRADLDQKALSELFYQYINVEEDFIKALFVARRDPAGPCLCARTGPSSGQRATRPGLRAGKPTSSRQPPASGWPCATAATRWRTWGRPATPPWTSA